MRLISFAIVLGFSIFFKFGYTSKSLLSKGWIKPILLLPDPKRNLAVLRLESHTKSQLSGRHLKNSMAPFTVFIKDCGALSTRWKT